ncbi:antibiotic biosynthesis monooxygenase [Streptomyces sp. CB02923]|uniref:antibiotic biosynthesis monooxygenase n=1 Tax=Streptomyces sp. CB02923 TaxID=1718985 RepID=UPI0019029952|nr:antibiotic biosynthesis monooxygenase [Streptomyces sp. CB02923]
MSIFVRARFDVRDRRQDGAERSATALHEAAGPEPGCPTYRWFTLPAPGAYLVLEEYADPAAAAAPQENAAGLQTSLGRCADMAFAEMYGPLGPGRPETGG